MRKREWIKLKYKKWEDCTNLQKREKLHNCFKCNTLYAWVLIGKDRQHYYVDMIKDKNVDADKVKSEFYKEYTDTINRVGENNVHFGKFKLRYLSRVLNGGDLHD